LYERFFGQLIVKPEQVGCLNYYRQKAGKS